MCLWHRRNSKASCRGKEARHERLRTRMALLRRNAGKGKIIVTERRPVVGRDMGAEVEGEG